MTPKEQIVSELGLICKQWDEAIERNDASEIGRYMSSDWVIIGTEGGITAKESFLDFIRSGDLHHTQMDFENIRIEVYGSSGVVTSKGTSSGTYQEQPFSYYEWSTSVFIKTEANWSCVLTMLTPAENKS